MKYSLEDAHYLIAFYNPKIIGQYLDNEKKYKIRKLKMIPLNFEKGFYFVQAHSYPFYSLNVYLMDINHIAAQLNLPSPQQILSNKISLKNNYQFQENL